MDLTLRNREFNFKVSNSPKNKVFEFEDFRLDANTKLLYRGGEQIDLTPKAVETLVALVESHGSVIGKHELIQKIWADTIVEESNLAQYLHILRKTLGNTTDGRPYIETLKRRGYRFNGMVRELNEPNALPESVEELNVEAPKVQPKTSNYPHRRVERHGNVLALADWGELENKPGIVEQKEPIQVPYHNNVRLLVLAGSVVVILLAFLTFNFFRPPVAGADEAGTVHGGLTITPLTNAEVVDQATISPDGKYFAYVEFGPNSRIWLQEVGGSSRIMTADLPGDSVICLTFTPDSSAIYYLAVREGERVASLYRVGTLGGVSTKILTDIYGPVSFSPDANEITFVRQDPDSEKTQLLVAAADGSHERVVLSRDGTEVIRPNPIWSPDGKQIAVGLMTRDRSISTCSMMGVEPSGENLKPLSNEKWDSCHRAAWLADGSGIVFVGTKFKEAVSTRRDQVYYLSAKSGTSSRLTNSGSRHEPWSLGVTNENEVLALPFTRLSQVWSLDVRADVQTATQMTTGRSDGAGGVEAWADGRIFYLARMGDNVGIFRIDQNGGRDNNPIVTDPTLEELRASPDGRFLVFAAKVEGYAHLFEVEPDGSNRRQLTFGETVQLDSTVSPDGRWVVYASHFFDGVKTQYSLKKIPAGGGEPVSLLNEYCGTPHFSNDGRMISCIVGDDIRVISSEGGNTLTTIKPVGIALLNSGARWTPDSKNLVYRVIQKEVANLWQHPINGDEARPLTNFTHGQIYNFAFAPEGSRIYLARGNPARNAILIKNFDRK